MRLLRILIACGLWCALASAHGLDEAALQGNYHFVQLLATVAPSGGTEDVHNLSGTVAFDGNGGFTWRGMLGRGAEAPALFAGSGTYAVAANGFVVLDNPDPTVTLRLNARLGDGTEIILGSSTEGPGRSIDFFVAVRAPEEAVNESVLTGEYTGAGLGFLNGSDRLLASTLLSFESAGGGMIPSVAVLGHAVDVAGDVNFTEEITNVPYFMHADGTGTADLREGFGNGAGLFFGDHDIFVSANGDYLLGSSREASGRQIFVAIKRRGEGAEDADFSGDFWITEIGVDARQGDHAYSSGTGALRSYLRESRGAVSRSERTRRGGLSFDESGANRFRIQSDGQGCLGPCARAEQVNMAIGGGAGGEARAFVGAFVDVVGVTARQHGIFFGVRMPSLSGSGVFLNPLGVANGASFAPPTFPIAPGAIVSLFGSGLAPEGVNESAETIPLPVSLHGVSVTVDGLAAPVLSVNPGQINIQVPFVAEGETAEIVVSNNGELSNAVEARLAPTAPGVFSLDATGAGPGVITHADFSLVSEQHPAAAGEVVILFLTGLGAVEPPAPAGAAGPSDPLSRVVGAENVVVRFNGGPAGEVQYAGLAPGFAGLYQINVRVPEDTGLVGAVSVAVETSNASTSFVEIAVAAGDGPE